MILANASVKWWRIFSPDQCSGINRFVALFVLPLLSFHFISANDRYAMNYRFIAADTLQKLIVLAVLAIWTKTSSRGCLEWTVTLFSLVTIPNTLVMGIPLLKGMYGPDSGSLMVQIVVLQCIIWYTLLLFLFEYRGAKLVNVEQFPDTTGSIVSFHVDTDITSLARRQGAAADRGRGRRGWEAPCHGGEVQQLAFGDMFPAIPGTVSVCRRVHHILAVQLIECRDIFASVIVKSDAEGV